MSVGDDEPPALLHSALSSLAGLGFIVLLRVRHSASMLAAGMARSRVRVVPIDEAQDQEDDDPPNDDHLHVFHPELVLQLAGALLELAGAVLQGVRLLVQLIQLLVPLEDLLHVVPHDSHHLVHLGLLLGHSLLGHNLLHLCRARQRPAVRPQRPSVYTVGLVCALNVSHASEGIKPGTQVRT